MSKIYFLVDCTPNKFNNSHLYNLTKFCGEWTGTYCLLRINRLD